MIGCIPLWSLLNFKRDSPALAAKAVAAPRASAVLCECMRAQILVVL